MQRARRLLEQHRNLGRVVVLGQTGRVVLPKHEGPALGKNGLGELEPSFEGHEVPGHPLPLVGGERPGHDLTLGVAQFDREIALEEPSPPGSPPHREGRGGHLAGRRFVEDDVLASPSPLGLHLYQPDGGEGAIVPGVEALGRPLPVAASHDREKRDIGRRVRQDAAVGGLKLPQGRRCPVRYMKFASTLELQRVLAILVLQNERSVPERCLSSALKNLEEAHLLVHQILRPGHHRAAQGAGPVNFAAR